TRVGHETDVDKDLAEIRFVSGNYHVAGQRQRTAGSGCYTIHAGNDRLGQVTHRQNHWIIARPERIAQSKLATSRGCVGKAFFEVGTRAEGFVARSGNDNDAYGLVGSGGFDSSRNVTDQGSAQGIVHLRTV